MGASWRIGVDPEERTDLVRHRLYRSVRNPIFTGMVLFAAGQALLVPDAMAVAGAGAAGRGRRGPGPGGGGTGAPGGARRRLPPLGGDHRALPARHRPVALIARR